MKVSILFFYLALFLIGASGIRYGVTQSAMPDNCLRILDINVWSGLDYEGYITMGKCEPDTTREKRFQALIRQIKQLDPDVIGIHEANKLPDYAERLSQEIDYAVFYHVGVGGVRLGPVGLPWNLCEGDVILAKKELNPQFMGRKQLSGGYVGNWASFHFSDATQIIAIKIDYKDHPIFIFTTHWHASLSDASYIMDKAKLLYDAGDITGSEYQNIMAKIEEGIAWRLSEAKKTIAFIKETAKDNLYILMGDFNAQPGSQEIAYLLKWGMVDLFQNANPDSSGFTWDPRSNLNIKEHFLRKRDYAKDLDAYTKLEYYAREFPKRIDCIFSGPPSFWDAKKIHIKSSRVVMKEIIQGVHASDHYGIFAEIQINQ